MPSSSEPSWLVALLGGGGVLGVFLSRGFDYLKLRRRTASGERRSAGKEWGALIDRLEKRLDATEKDAKEASLEARQAAARLAECESGHVACRTELSILRRAMNEMRQAAGMDLLPEGS